MDARRRRRSAVAEVKFTIPHKIFAAARVHGDAVAIRGEDGAEVRYRWL